MRITDTKIVRRVAYASLGEATAACRAANPEDSQESIKKGSSEYSQWSGTDSLETALKLIENGSPDLTKKVVKKRGEIPSPMNATFATHVDVAGSYPDVGLYMLGDPEHMVAFVPVMKPKPIVRLAFNYAYSASTRHDRIIGWGASLAALVDNLESRNIRVELDAVYFITSWNSSGKYWLMSVPVKTADQPLDLAKLAVCTASPAFLRRFGFHLADLEPPEIRKMFGFTGGGGYGNCVFKAPDWCEEEYDIYYNTAHYDNTYSENWAAEETARILALPTHKE